MRGECERGGRGVSEERSERSAMHSIIAAHDQNFGIGKENKLPWHIEGDLKFFQNVTTVSAASLATGMQLQNAVVMGRNTWQSLPGGRPLKRRTNIVLTKNAVFPLPDRVLRASNLQEALQIAADRACPKIFVIGGAAVYREAMTMDIFDTLYITEVEGVYDCDTFLPDYKNIFTLFESSPLNLENNYRYQFKTYKRKE